VVPAVDLISDLDQKQWFEKQNNDPHTHMYTVWCKANRVGAAGLTSHDFQNRRAEFSLYIDPEKQENGIGTAALKTLLNHGFKNLNLHSIWGETFEDNKAMKMFESLGFKQEGVRRDFYFKKGKYINAYLYSILEDEWKP
jgi:Acetyltransferases, including N-acetylases of ribosomal proteins